MPAEPPTPAAPKPDPSRTPGQGLTKEEALHRLLEGHWRYLENRRAHRSITEDDRARHAAGQYPFAVIVGCADSRVSPELIFDQGLGDLFVVRVAGNYIGTGVTASVEYALEYGSNTLEIHRDAIQPGQKILIVDDLLATGGTVKGTIELVERLKGELVGLSFLVELSFLHGRDRLGNRRVTSVIRY